MPEGVVVVDHPLVQDKLARLRDRTTGSADFRRLVNELAPLLGYEVTRDLPLAPVEIETPLVRTTVRRLAGAPPVVVAILRAGNALLEGMLGLLPSAAVGYIGLYRDPETLEPVEYYFKMPADLTERPVILVDPMLATGNSASAALTRLEKAGAHDLHFLCLLAAPEGVARLRKAHPSVPIVTAAIDERLNEHGYILPGLGDAGDRLYGTE